MTGTITVTRSTPSLRSVTVSPAAGLWGLRKAYAPEPMHASVVRFHIGVGAFIGILVLRPELRIAGSDQLARDACGVIQRPGIFCPIGFTAQSPRERHKDRPGRDGVSSTRTSGADPSARLRARMSVDGRTLGLVNGRNIAVIDIAIAVFADDDIPAIIETDR